MCSLAKYKVVSFREWSGVTFNYINVLSFGHQTEWLSSQISLSVLQADADELVTLAEEVNAAQAGSAKQEQLDPAVIKKLSCVAAGDLAPVNAFIGGLAAQEVMKVNRVLTLPLMTLKYFDMRVLPRPFIYCLSSCTCTGLHWEVYACQSMAVFWCRGVFTWGFSCSYRGRVCTCESSTYLIICIRLKILRIFFQRRCFEMVTVWYKERFIYCCLSYTEKLPVWWSDCCLWFQGARPVSQTAVFSGKLHIDNVYVADLALQ